MSLVETAELDRLATRRGVYVLVVLGCLFSALYCDSRHREQSNEQSQAKAFSITVKGNMTVGRFEIK